MEKLKCEVCAPIGEYSYFGNKSRVFTKSLIETRSDFDVHIIEYQTNNVKNGYFDEFLKPFANKTWDENEWKDPDVCLFFGSPVLFEKKGTKCNIGFLDTTAIMNFEDVKLVIDRCNMMNLILVSSNYAKTTLKNLKYVDGGTEYSISTHIVITTEYSVISEINDIPGSILGSINSPSNFLLEGDWDVDESETFGGKNKDNIRYVVRNYLEAFKDVEGAPNLILNVHGQIPSTVDIDKLNSKLNDIIKTVSYEKSIPKVYLINGILENTQIKSLYNDPKILAMIHVPQRTDTIESELNFMSTGKPIIYSGFGTQTEALGYKGNIPVNCQIKELQVSDIQGSGPNLADIYGDYLKFALYEVYHHYNELKQHSMEGSRAFLQTNTKERMLSIFNDVVKYFVPVQVTKEES